MQKIGWILSLVVAGTAGYYYFQMQEQNRLAAVQLKSQTEKIAELQANVQARTNTADAELAAEQKKLTALEHQLVAAQTALELAKSQFGDAKEQISVDSRMPVARDDLAEAKANLKTAQEQLAALDRRVHDIQVREQDQHERDTAGRQRIEATYDYQIQSNAIEVNRIRGQLATQPIRRPDSPDRTRLKTALGEQELALQDLKDQKQAALGVLFDQNVQTRTTLAAQRETIRTERVQIQQQIDNIKSHYQDLKGDNDAHDDTVASDKNAAKAQQDTVQAQQLIVNKLENDIRITKEVVDHFNAH